jgi:hypothetical protein
LAVIYAVSTSAPNPLQAISVLSSRPLELPVWVETTVLRYILIVHTSNSPLNRDEYVLVHYHITLIIICTQMYGTLQRSQETARSTCTFPKPLPRTWAHPNPNNSPPTTTALRPFLKSAICARTIRSPRHKRTMDVRSRRTSHWKICTRILDPKFVALDGEERGRVE